MERKKSSGSGSIGKSGSRPAAGARDSGARSNVPFRRRRSDFRLSQVPPGCPAFVADPAFREIASVRIYGRNSRIISQGDPARHAFILRRGLVHVTSLMPNGKAFMDLMGPGSIFGVPWILTGLPYGFGVTACEECEFDQVEAPLFLRHLEHSPGAALEVMRHLCRQEVQIIRHMLSLAVKVPSRERLLSVLYELSRVRGEPGESGIRITMPLTVQMLADRIGCSRQWVSKLLGELEAQGKLKRKGSWINLTVGTGRSAGS